MSKAESITTPEDKDPMMMRLGKHGWRDMATIERRDELEDRREKMRQKSKETL
jgi:hypothetical protein